MPLPESQRQNLALTVLYVPSLLYSETLKTPRQPEASGISWVPQTLNLSFQRQRLTPLNSQNLQP